MPVGAGGPGDPPPEGGDPRERLMGEARRNGLGFAHIDRIWIDKEALEAIPLVLQNEYNVLPVKKDGQTLYVAMGEISAPTCKALASFTGLRIVPVLALADRFPKARRRAAQVERWEAEDEE